MDETAHQFSCSINPDTKLLFGIFARPFGAPCMELKNVVFVILLAAAFGIFSRSALRLISWLNVGKPDNRFDRLGERIKTTLVVGIGQSKILRDKVAGPIHAGIFWGFLILLFSAIEMVIEGIHDGWSLNFLG
ncbi:MAG: hypothetical protein ACK55I_23025, partial [bacterium]